MICRDSTLDWAIIGGGIHGAYLTNALIRHRITKRSDLRIVDPNDEPLAEWKRITANVGMEYLRSPKVHHLDLEPFSLKHFIQCDECTENAYITPNDRPSLTLFNAHADRVIKKNGLNKLYRTGYALNIECNTDFVTVTTDRETIRSRNVILAIGLGGKTRWPEWAYNAAKEGAGICHVLDGSFCRDSIPECGEIVVVGGGMSAVQTALSIANENRRVTLLSPHSLRQNNYDSDPGWMGPKYLNRFRRITSWTKRRSVIDQARNNGSITHELKYQLQRCINRGELRILVDETGSCSVLTHELILLNLRGGESIGANHVILATGYDNRCPGGSLVKKFAEEYGLRCSECGSPITDTSLQWCDRIFVSGALAELEVGPASRNIIGARMASEKILSKFVI